MKIIKRSGREAEFNLDKIINAVKKANEGVIESDRLTDEQIEQLAHSVEYICSKRTRSLNVEEIQDLVENEIMRYNAFNLARAYITYRYKRQLVRKSNTTDDLILTLIECNNEEVKQENSNKTLL